MFVDSPRKYVNNLLGRLSTMLVLLFCLIVSLFIGIFDFLLGPELSFSVFYTIPIMIAGWYSDKTIGISVALFSAAVWLGADLIAGSQYSTILVPIWNTFVRLAFFLIILWLLIVVRQQLKLEESLADTDPLTNLANRRLFLEQLEQEYVRVQRYPEPFTIAYFDLDNFKYVNDTMGHSVGDELLVLVANSLRSSIRISDFAARLGGDEFAVLFPKLEAESTLSALETIPKKLKTIMEKNECNRPVITPFQAASCAVAVH